jgi:hypothetical protein
MEERVFAKPGHRNLQRLGHADHPQKIPVRGVRRRHQNVFFKIGLGTLDAPTAQPQNGASQIFH